MPGFHRRLDFRLEKGPAQKMASARLKKWPGGGPKIDLGVTGKWSRGWPKNGLAGAKNWTPWRLQKFKTQNGVHQNRQI